MLLTAITASSAGGGAGGRRGEPRGAAGGTDTNYQASGRDMAHALNRTAACDLRRMARRRSIGLGGVSTGGRAAKPADRRAHRSTTVASRRRRRWGRHGRRRGAAAASSRRRRPRRARRTQGQVRRADFALRRARSARSTRASSTRASRPARRARAAGAAVAARDAPGRARGFSRARARPRPLARQKCAIGDTFAIKIMDKAHIAKHGKAEVRDDGEGRWLAPVAPAHRKAVVLLPGARAPTRRRSVARAQRIGAATRRARAGGVVGAQGRVRRSIGREERARPRGVFSHVYARRLSETIAARAECPRPLEHPVMGGARRRAGSKIEIRRARGRARGGGRAESDRTRFGPRRALLRRMPGARGRTPARPTTSSTATSSPRKTRARARFVKMRARGRRRTRPVERSAPVLGHSRRDVAAVSRSCPPAQRLRPDLAALRRRARARSGVSVLLFTTATSTHGHRHHRARRRATPMAEVRQRARQGVGGARNSARHLCRHGHQRGSPEVLRARSRAAARPRRTAMLTIDCGRSAASSSRCSSAARRSAPSRSTSPSRRSSHQNAAARGRSPSPRPCPRPRKQLIAAKQTLTKERSQRLTTRCPRPARSAPARRAETRGGDFGGGDGGGAPTASR